MTLEMMEWWGGGGAERAKQRPGQWKEHPGQEKVRAGSERPRRAPRRGTQEVVETERDRG